MIKTFGTHPSLTMISLPCWPEPAFAARSCLPQILH
jgi:hypothetical protein